MTKPLAMFAVLALFGCARGDKPATDSTTAAAADSGAPRALSASPASTQGAAQPGRLTKPIDQYTGDELYTFTHGLTFVGGADRQRRCRGQADCGGARPTAFTRIFVDAVQSEDSLSPRTVPENGIVIVRALNRGQLADLMYDTKPGGQYEYYLILLPVPGGNSANWRLEELTTTPGNRAHRSIGTGTMRECNHPFVPGARADFKSCASASGRPAAFGAFQSDPEDPLWFSCSTGCCTAEGDKRG